MPDGNGSEHEPISTGNPLVDAALRRLQERNDQRFKDLEDAMVVQAYLEKQQSATLKRHSELHARQDVLMTEIQEKSIFCWIAKCVAKAARKLDRQTVPAQCSTWNIRNSC